MRKGSKKVVTIPEEKLELIPLGNIDSFKIISDKKVLDILIRLCDACHDMDGHYEPWASIRHDIEEMQ